ncbi:MAG: MFS transporter [Promethearchaeota archaeon]
MKEEEKTKTTGLEAFKKLPKEERKKIREQRRIEAGLPTKMNIYLWFVLFFSSIVTFFDGWCTLAITLAMGSFAGGVDLIQQLNNPDLFTYFGITASPVMMGIILSIAGTGVVVAVSFKYFVDKYGRRPLTLITAVPFITFSVLTAFVPKDGLILFLILRICANYFLSADVVTIIIAEESPNHLRGRLVAMVLAMNAVGGFICGIIQATGIRINFGGLWGFTLNTWQSLFFLTIIGYLFIIPLFIFLKETKRFQQMKKYEEWRAKKGLKAKAGWFAPLQRKYARGMATGMIVGFLAQLIYFAQVTFFALYFAKEQNLTPKAVGIVSLPLMLAAGLGFFMAGPILDRWGRIPTIHRFGCTTLVGGMIFSWPTVYIVGDIPNPLLMGIVLAGGMMGIFSLTILSAAGTIIPMEMLPTHIRSTAMGWIGAISRGATIVAPFLMMYGAETLGGLGFTYQAMFALMGMPLTTILFTAYILAPESKGRELEEIVATETYSKMKKVSEEEYRKPYYYFALAISSFYVTGLIYGNTSDTNFMNVFIIVSFYSVLCLICFILVIFARRIITE